MAKKRLKIKDKQGNVVDFDISAASVTIDAEGKTLDVKLSELVSAIAKAVKSVTFNGNSPTADADGNVNLGHQIQADWKESNTTWPSFIKNKPSFATVATSGDYNDLSNKPAIPDGVECDAQMSSTSEKPVQNKVIKAYVDNLINGLVNGAPAALDTLKELADALDGNDDAIAALTNAIAAKANDNAVVKTVTVNGGTPQSPVNGNVDISVEGGGSVESVTVNGTKHTPDANGDVNLGNLRGQDGNSGVASADGLESVNNLNGGTTDTTSRVYVLGANQGKRLRDQIENVYQRMQSLYSLMSGLAFTNTKPAASTVLPDLDWGNPKHAVTLSLNLSNAVVKHNGAVVNNGASILVEEGSTLMLIVEASSGYALTSVTSSTTGATVTDLSNGTYSVELVMGGSNVALNIIAVAARTYNVALSLVGCTMSSGPTSLPAGSNGVFVFSAKTNYALPSTNPSVGGASVSSWNNNTGELIISNVTGDVSISVVATLSQFNVYMNKSIDRNGIPVNDTDSCFTDYIELEQLAEEPLAWSYQLGRVNSDNQLGTWRNLVFYDSNKRMLFNDSKWDAKRTPLSYTQNAEYTRTLTAEQVGAILATAGQNVPVFVRASFGASNGAVKANCGLEQGQIDFIDITKAVVATFSETIHSLTFNLNNCTTTATGYQDKVLNGQPVELLFSPTNGGNLSDFSISASIGGVAVPSSDIVVTNYTDVNGNSNYKMVVIENITGDLVINASM